MLRRWIRLDASSSCLNLGNLHLDLQRRSCILIMIKTGKIRPRGPSSMLPLNSIIKNAFDKFIRTFKTANLPEGKYIQPPPTTVKWYQLGQSCYEDNTRAEYRLAKICFSPKSSGLLWSRLLFLFLKY